MVCQEGYIKRALHYCSALGSLSPKMLFSEHLNPHEALSSLPMKTTNRRSHHSGHSSHREAAPRPRLPSFPLLELSCQPRTLTNLVCADYCMYALLELWYRLLNVRILQSVWIALCMHPVRFDSNSLGLTSGYHVITYLVMSDGFQQHSWWSRLIQFAPNSGI
eukprot:1612760-Ditylum_brightwellii.AAC.1